MKQNNTIVNQKSNHTFKKEKQINTFFNYNDHFAPDLDLWLKLSTSFES